MAAIGGPLYFMFLAPPPSDHPGSDAVVTRKSEEFERILESFKKCSGDLSSCSSEHQPINTEHGYQVNTRSLQSTPPPPPVTPVYTPPPPPPTSHSRLHTSPPSHSSLHPHDTTPPPPSLPPTPSPSLIPAPDKGGTHCSKIIHGFKLNWCLISSIFFFSVYQI